MVMVYRVISVSFFWSDHGSGGNYLICCQVNENQKNQITDGVHIQFCAHLNIQDK